VVGTWFTWMRLSVWRDNWNETEHDVLIALQFPLSSKTRKMTEFINGQVGVPCHGIFLFLFSHLFSFFLRGTQASSGEVFNLPACLGCLKGGFHPGICIFLFYFSLSGYLKEVLNPRDGLRCLMEFFIQASYCIFFLFTNKSNLKKFCDLEARTLPITFTSLLMVLMNSSLDIGPL